MIDTCVCADRADAGQAFRGHSVLSIYERRSVAINSIYGRIHIYGDAGRDTLTGGTAADRFSFCEGDTNGDGTADLVIGLWNTIPLTAVDFVL